MTVPASAIPGPRASAADVMTSDAAAEPMDRSVSRNFLANLQHLARLKDKADLVQYGIMLLVEIATLEERVTDLEASIVEEVAIAKQELTAVYQPIIDELRRQVLLDAKIRNAPDG